MEPGTLHMIGKCSASEPYPSPQFTQFGLKKKMMSHKIEKVFAKYNKNHIP
jgi:hypothetical protein